MKEKDKKKQIAKITVFITSVFVIFMSVTYGFITQVLTGTKEVVINAGVLDLVLEEENAITISNALPMYDEVGMIQEAFVFRIINNTSNDTDYILKIKEINSNSLSNTDVRYGLVKNGTRNIGYVSDITDGIIDEGTIAGSTSEVTSTIEYSLRLWIRHDLEEITDIQNKSFSVSLSLEVSQTDPNSEEGKNTFAVYSTDDNSLRFYNRRSVPAVGNVYNGLTVTEIYTDFIDQEYGNDENWNYTAVPWDSYKESVTNVVVEDKISPISTTSWFQAFYNCSYFEVSKIDTSNVTNMSNMFLEAGANWDGSLVNFSIVGLENWDVSNVTDMSSMFRGAGQKVEKFILTGLDNWDTSSVVYMNDMFSTSGNNSIKWNIGDLSTKQVTRNDGSVYTAWDVSNVTNIEAMFAGISLYPYDHDELLDLDLGYNVVLNLSNWNLSNCKNINEVFNFSGITELNLSNWKVSDSVEMRGGIYSVSYLRKITVSEYLDLSNMELETPSDLYIAGATGNWINEETKEVYTTDTIPDNVAATYVAETNVKTGAFAIYSKTDNSLRFYNRTSIIASASEDTLERLEGRLYDGRYINEIYTGFDTEVYTSKDDMPYNTEWYGGIDVHKVVIEDVVKPVSTAYWFYGMMWCNEFDLAKLDTSDVTDMSYMFYGVVHETDLILDLSNFNTSKVTNMSYMFSNSADYSYNAKISGLENWDTSNVENMSHMFSGFANDWNVSNVDISGIENWNTSKVTNMNSMFKEICKECGIYERNINFNIGNLSTKTVTNNGKTYTAWDVSNVEDMSSMFKDMLTYSKSFTELDLSTWNVSKLENMSYMFYNTAYNTLNTIKTPYNISSSVIMDSITDKSWYDLTDNNKEYTAGTFPTGITTSHTLKSIVE